ncbi:hypothetical protein O181_067936 [Austropuccinia psidii MF-1]|uniref:Uncharacterized protein n=1 Tax=Austropuccinia psidii MF-1 TaxID=1389203 RepID=A0A9Q3I3I0_9BASI|nr:hypothetical protein [Austropuccinia psidii MF-1]
MPTLTLEFASASLPNPLQCLACLCARTPLQMRLQHCPPSPPSPPPHLLLGLKSLCCCGSLHLPLTILKLLECLPNMPPMPLTILTLV